ncbi:hypothetical protein FA048_10915 [Pedobacter polaris]|uniref:Uncharacterized protein n=1 Tax=Pedobacter polaris TaxID=2571273 RepID=A0A4U1CWJ2_9SPHI|nr:hypothetical protein [Pedobacter polaris]TKC10679.1 hypothetical protein FA048_10915 [Pedobacter polaris]
MKYLKYLAFFYLLFAFAPKSNAQDFDNLYAVLAEGFTIEELHDYADILTYSNHRSVLEKKGMKYEKNDTSGGSYIYKKNDYVSFYVNYEAGKLTSVHFVSSPQKFYKAIAEMKGNSEFVKSSEKASGNGKLIYYKYKGHSMSTNDNYYRVTMWFKETASTTTSSTTTPTQTPTITPTVENYYSAKEIADAMNANIGWADIGFSTSYKFEVKGAMNMDKRSIRFISKENVLYVQMNIPRNGECDYGLKEVKAKWTGQAGSGSTYFYLTFDYLYSCNGQDYKGVYVYFNPTSSFTKTGVQAWVQKNAYK